MKDIKLKLTPEDVVAKPEELQEALETDAEVRAFKAITETSTYTQRLTKGIAKSLSDKTAKARAELNKRRLAEWEGELVNGVDLYNHPNLFLRQQYRNVIDSGGKLYLVLEGDTIVGIQPHKPFVQGTQLMKTEQELGDTANEHIKQIVHNNLLVLAVREIKEEILK